MAGFLKVLVSRFRTFLAARSWEVVVSPLRARKGRIGDFIDAGRGGLKIK